MDLVKKFTLHSKEKSIKWKRKPNKQAKKNQHSKDIRDKDFSHVRSFYKKEKQGIFCYETQSCIYRKFLEAMDSQFPREIVLLRLFSILFSLFSFWCCIEKWKEAPILVFFNSPNCLIDIIAIVIVIMAISHWKDPHKKIKSRTTNECHFISLVWPL